MNIQAERIHEHCHISVMGLLDTPEEQQQFLRLLRDQQGISEIHITFFDAHSLPAVIIEAIRFHLEQFADIPLRLFVLHRRLSSYLSRLNIPNKLVQKKTLQPSSRPPFRALAIGGSAESLDKIFLIIRHLPQADISVFIVQHIPKDARNMLDTLLQASTPFRATIATHGESVVPGAIYIAPSDFHLTVRNGRIELHQKPPVNYARPSIDVLFESLAREYEQTLLAVLLCGYGHDGSQSLETLRHRGALIVIEDPLDCSARDMPRNALHTGHYDYKFPIQEIVSYVSRIIQPRDIVIDYDELHEFLKALDTQYGYDYQNYSQDSITRRLQKIMREQGVYDFRYFRSQVLSDPELFEELFLEFSINVTHFFRNPHVFQQLRHEIFPYLETYPHIKIWCAGCSTGEEPYSLAILLHEAGLLKKSQIYATDINPLVIAEAKNGLFSQRNFETDQQNYRDSGGNGSLKTYFEGPHSIVKIQDQVREKILFFQHSLVNSGILNEFHLIVCRNVLIYFNQDLQQQTLQLFHDSLDRSGFLVLGESESITTDTGTVLFEDYAPRHKIYRKRKDL